MAHTPGPWTVVTNSRPSLKVAAHSEPVATIRPRTRTNDGDVGANARLIAAAPDLLQALKLVAEYIGKPVNGYHTIALRTAHADKIIDAINKAEGAAE